MKQKSAGPTWGGQGWRPGKQSGTWFRHSLDHGPLVHDGETITILKRRQKVSENEWLVLNASAKTEAKTKLAIAIETMQGLRAALLAELERDVSPFLDLPGWTVVNHNARDIEYVGWKLLYKECPVWHWTYSYRWQALQLEMGSFGKIFGDDTSEAFVNKAKDHEKRLGREEDPSYVTILPRAKKMSKVDFDRQSPPALESAAICVYYGNFFYCHVLNAEGEVTSCDESPRRRYDAYAPHTKYDDCK